MAEVVGAEHQLVAVLGLPTWRGVERDPCVADHCVELVEVQPVHGGLQGRQGGEVQLKVPHVRAGDARADRGHGGVRLRGVPAAEHHDGSSGGELLRDEVADPGVASGDQESSTLGRRQPVNVPRASPGMRKTR